MGTSEEFKVVDLRRLLSLLDARTRPNVADLEYERKKRAAERMPEPHAQRRPQYTGRDREERVRPDRRLR